MCSHQEWESLRRRFQEAVDEDELREFVADAAARVEAFIEDLKRRACAPENADWACGRGRRSRAEWVAQPAPVVGYTRRLPDGEPLNAGK